jgi:hypothetical protein
VVGEQIIPTDGEALERDMSGSSRGGRGVALAWPAHTRQLPGYEEDGEGRSSARAP